MTGGCSSRVASSSGPEVSPTAIPSTSDGAAQASLSKTPDYEQTLELEAWSFRVTCPNNSSENTVTISATNKAATTASVTATIDGTIVNTVAADLDKDGNPEVYIFVQSAGSGSYGSVLAFSTNSEKSLTPIAFVSATNEPGKPKGYMGHDEFSIVDNELVQSFPVYRESDRNSSPSGGTRKIYYKLTTEGTQKGLHSIKVVES